MTDAHPTQPLRLTAVQADLAWEDPDANFAHLSELLSGGGVGGSDLVVLPEMFATGFSMRGGEMAALAGEVSLAWLRARARERDACAVASTAFLADDGTPVNRMFAVAPSGKTAHYDKRHRFAMAGEREAYGPGSPHPVIVPCRGWRVLLQVCYDLRFPVYSRNRPGAEGYDLAVYVANWPEARRGHWRTLLRARAIENQAYVAGVNRVGTDGNGLRYAGDTLVVDPLGEIVLDAGVAEGVHAVELSADHLRATRTRLPFLVDADAFKLLEDRGA